MKRLISLIAICALLLTLSSCGQTDSQTSEQSASDSSSVQAEPGENGYFYEIDDSCVILYNGSYADESRDNMDSFEWTITLLENSDPVYGIAFSRMDETGLLYGDEAFREFSDWLAEFPESSGSEYYPLDFFFCSKSPFTYNLAIKDFQSHVGKHSTKETLYDFYSEDLENTFTLEAGGETWYAAMRGDSLHANWEIDIENVDFPGVAPFWHGYEPEPIENPVVDIVDNKEKYGEEGEYGGYYYEALQHYIEQYLVD